MTTENTSPTNADIAPATNAESAAAANWRPTRTNALLGVGLTVVLVGMLIAMSGETTLAGASVASGILLALAMLLVTRDRHSVLFRLLAGLLVFPAGAATVATAALALRTQPPIGSALFALGVCAAVGGAALAPWNPLEDLALLPPVFLPIFVIFYPTVVVVGLLVLSVPGIGTAAAQVGEIALGLLLATDESAISGYLSSVFTMGLVILAATALRVGLSAIPLAEMVSRDRRDELASQIAAVARGLQTVRLIAAMLLVGLAALAAEPVRVALGAYLPQRILLLAVNLGAIPQLRIALLGLTALGFGTVVLVWAAKRLAQSDTEAALSRDAPHVAGFGIIAGAFLFSGEAIQIALTGPLVPYRSDLLPLLDTFGPVSLGLAGAILACLVPIVVYVVLGVLRYLGFRNRPASAALASGGLFVATVGILLDGTVPVVSFIGVAGSLLVWDVSSHAVTVGDEIGRRAPTRHAELVHAGGALCVALLGVGVATGGLLAVRGVPTPSQVIAPLALIASLAGILVVLFGLRRRG